MPFGDELAAGLPADLQVVERRGWETSIVTTLDGDHSWLPRLRRLTPDVFAAPHFLRPSDYPRFLRYMIESRRPDVVLGGGGYVAGPMVLAGKYSERINHYNVLRTIEAMYGLKALGNSAGVKPIRDVWQ